MPSGQADRFAVLERAVEARGRLLRVEASPVEASPGRLALTFDVGRVVLEASKGRLETATVPDRGALPGPLESQDEEEPWWRVLGNPVTALWPDEQGRSLRMRFREEAENPRVVRIEVLKDGLLALVEDVS